MLLFSDQILGGGKSFREGQTASRGRPCLPCGRQPETNLTVDIFDLIFIWKKVNLMRLLVLITQAFNDS